MSKKKPPHFRFSDLRSINQLAVNATIGVTKIVEGVQQSIWASLGFGKKTSGITKLVYQLIYGSTHLVGKALDTALAGLEPYFKNKDKTTTAERELALAALNGVMGDRLEQNKNEFAIQPSITGIPSAELAKSKVVLFIHGLCMNDLKWLSETGFSYGELLASELNCSCIYFKYNSGKHISQNGVDLAKQLELLVEQWPVELDDLTIVAHSMGGLLARSACAISKIPTGSKLDSTTNWLPKLKRLVFLGTPHFGAPLERAGNWVDLILGSTSFSKPLAKIGQLRSAGITDLRYGYILEDDWKGKDRFAHGMNRATPVPLPEKVRCYAVAASIASEDSPTSEQLIGDGLVPLRSALGKEGKEDRGFFDEKRRAVFYKTNHMELLYSKEIGQLLNSWLD